MQKETKINENGENDRKQNENNKQKVHFKRFSFQINCSFNLWGRERRGKIEKKQGKVWSRERGRKHKEKIQKRRMNQGRMA